MQEAVGDAANPLRLRVAAEVRAWRAKRNMSQQQLARALGISQPQVSSRLRGATPITLDEIETFARIFGTTADAILAGALANDERPHPFRDEASSLPRLDSNQQPADFVTPQVSSLARVVHLAERRPRFERRVRERRRPTRRLTPQPFGPNRVVPMAAAR